MDGRKVKVFMDLAGQRSSGAGRSDLPLKQLGARLLLTEVLEYVISGLGLGLEIDGQRIVDPEAINFFELGTENPVEMLDGLADVAYTMYWNSHAFSLPLEQAFERVCDNNLQKFVLLEDWEAGEGPLGPDQWHLGREVQWPDEVREVSVVRVEGEFYAVGKDEHGKVRKPSTYQPVELADLVLESTTSATIAGSRSSGDTGDR